LIILFFKRGKKRLISEINEDNYPAKSFIMWFINCNCDRLKILEILLFFMSYYMRIPGKLSHCISVEKDSKSKLV